MPGAGCALTERAAIPRATTTTSAARPKYAGEWRMIHRPLKKICLKWNRRTATSGANFRGMETRRGVRRDLSRARRDMKESPVRQEKGPGDGEGERGHPLKSANGVLEPALDMQDAAEHRRDEETRQHRQFHRRLPTMESPDRHFHPPYLSLEVLALGLELLAVDLAPRVALAQDLKRRVSGFRRSLADEPADPQDEGDDHYDPEEEAEDRSEEHT